MSLTKEEFWTQVGELAAGRLTEDDHVGYKKEVGDIREHDVILATRLEALYTYLCSVDQRVKELLSQ